MKKNMIRIFAVLCLLTMVLGIVPASAAAYNTYTYSINGESLASPDAYTPEMVVDNQALDLMSPDGKSALGLTNPTSIEADSDGNVYIADPKNNRIVVLNKYYQYKYQITSFVNDQGVDDALNQAQGVFIWENNEVQADGTVKMTRKLYVADTENRRIVIFDKDGKYLTHIEEPESEVFEEDEIYKPIAMAADEAGRLYVISGTTYQGVIALTPEGEFAGYIGAMKASYSAIEMLWRQFMTKEQLAARPLILSTEYNNITIDEKGFIYITCNSMEDEDLANAIRNKDANYAPVKKLNTAGNDILRRNGFFIPAGEVNFRSAALSTENAVTGPSSIVDVALGPEGTWSIVDSTRSKIFTYDDNGELLFAFGDLGSQLGNLRRIVGLTYCGDKLLVLDGETSSFTVYKRTEYGNQLIQAIKHNNDRQYDLAEADWKGILQRNNNFDAAYIGLGNAYYRQGKWEEAMEMYKAAYDVEGYSDCFHMVRKEIVERIFIVIPIVAVTAIVLVVLFFKYAGKVNAKAAVSGKKKTYKEELLYACHVIFHPFDGFWDLKHEKRGSVRAALTILALAVLVFAYQAVGQAYIFNPNGSFTSIIAQLAGLLVPLVLYCAGNWCLTTLFEGEGSFKDVFVASCYCLTPIVLLIPLSTILTHFVTTSETGFITLINGVCYVWLFLLLFFGTMTTHDFTLGKNIIMTIATVLCMAVIMFVIILFSSLLVKMFSFVSNVVTEISYRMS